MTTLWNALNAIYISILSTDFRFNSFFLNVILCVGMPVMVHQVCPLGQRALVIL